MAKAEAILKATPKNGKLVFDNRFDAEKYFIENEDISLILEIRQEDKYSQKERMYSFFFGPLLHYAMLGFTHAGYEGMDKTKARYLLQAEFLKEDMIGPNGVQPYLLEISSISKARLLKFIVDCLFYLEDNLGQRVPDSEEWKAMNRGDGFLSVKHKKEE